jgi:hypothetical protein
LHLQSKLTGLYSKSTVQRQNRGYTYMTDVEKPEYHHPLFFVKLDDGRTAVTFVESKKPTRETIIGWINEGSELKTDTFEENPQFFNFVQKIIASVVHDDPQINAMAKYAAMTSKSSGHVHVGDHRNPAGDGRIPYPHDIIGSCRYDETGKVIAGSYSPNDVWRPLMNDYGLFQLDEFLHAALVEALAKQ